MNDLYRAVEILGRSVEDVGKFGWGFCTLGQHKEAEKCVNGVLAIAARQSRPMYVHSVVEIEPELTAPMRLACIALIETAPPHIVQHLYDEGNWWHDTPKTLESDSMEYLGELLVNVNDAEIATDEWDEDGERIRKPLLNQEGARNWFDRALDLLAKQLPEPIPADPPLTVQQIIDTPMVGEDCTGYICATHGSLQHDDETCPVHELA